MKRFFVVPFVVLALVGCSQTPYKILDRITEGPMGLVTKIRADVPAGATKEELQSWCTAITKDEATEGVVTIEFLEEGPVVRQKAFCMGGQIVMLPNR